MSNRPAGAMHSALSAEVAEELSALRREVALYHAVLRALPQSAVLVYDQELRCVAVGGETMRMLAPDASSAAGQSVRELIPEAQRAAEVARYEATLRGETMSGDSFHEAHVLTSRYVPLRDEADHIIGGMVVSRIVTDEREETKRRELYQAIVEQSPYAITATDAYRKIVMLNRANATMLGYASTDDLLGQDGISITGSESLEQVDQEIGPSLMAHGVWHGLIQARRQDGSKFWSNQTIQNLVNAAGEYLGTVAFAKDISTELAAREEREQLVTNLTERERELRIFKELVDRAPDGVAFGNAGSLFPDYVNAAFRTITGYGETALNRTYVEMFGPNALAMMERDATPEIFEQGYWSNRMPAQRPDGSTWLCHNTCYFFQTPDSEEAQWVAFYRDVTEQVRSEQQQRELQEQIIAAQDAALRELSTPLIPITDGVVAMPLIGSIDSKRAQLVIETLLSGVAKTRANTAIIDITGVSVVDTQVANALLRAAQSIKLLGANAILTGIRPEVAQTLIGLGVDLSGISTCATLQSGIAEALNRGSDTNRSGRGIPGSRSVSYP